MASILFKGAPVKLSGELPSVGSKAKDFKLTTVDLTDVSLKDFAGKKKVLNIFPTIETSVCAASVRKFNEKASSLKNTVVLCISCDMPMGFKRFCGAEGLTNVITLSELHDRGFAEDYGVRYLEGGFKGLMGRSIVVLDENDTVLYTQLVHDTGTEPDYDAAIKALG